MRYVPQPNIVADDRRIINELILNSNEINEKINDLNEKAVKLAIEKAEEIIRKWELGENGQLNQVLELVHEVFKRDGDYSSIQRYAFKKVLEERLYNHWSEEGKEKFDKKCEIIFEWNVLFFSYTSRSCRRDYGGIAITAAFRSFLLKKKRLTRREYNGEQNYIAEIIFKEVSPIGGFECFYDQDNVRNGNKIDSTIFENCKKSLTLVQFIEPAVFEVRQDEEINWTLTEFRTFKKAIKENEDFISLDNRYFFILTEKELKDVCELENLPGNHPDTKAFEDWYNFIKNSKSVNVFPISDEAGTSKGWSKVIKDLKSIRIDIVRRRNKIIKELLVN